MSLLSDEVCIPDFDADVDLVNVPLCGGTAGFDDLASIASERCTDVVVLDISHRFLVDSLESLSECIVSLHKLGCFVVMIDGMRDECFSPKLTPGPDLVVMPYAGAENFVQDRARYLAGEKFAILSPDYADRECRAELPRTARRVIVSMGGSDPYNLTQVAASALALIRVPDLHVVIIVGPGYDPIVLNQCREVLRTQPCSVEFVQAPESLREYLLASDVAIINDGLTKYEAAACAVPMIVLSTKAQSFSSQEFGTLGCSIGFVVDDQPFEVERLAAVLSKLIEDQETRAQMVENCARRIDGAGGDKVVCAIEGELAKDAERSRN